MSVETGTITIVGPSEKKVVRAVREGDVLYFVCRFTAYKFNWASVKMEFTAPMGIHQLLAVSVKHLDVLSNEQYNEVCQKFPFMENHDFDMEGLREDGYW